MALAVPVSIRQLGLDVVSTEDLDPEKYEIVGTDMQLLRLHLAPGEKVTAEPGAMTYMHEDVKAGCDSNDCCARCLSGSPCIMGTFEATGPGAYVGLTPVRPAKVLPLRLGGRRFLGKDRAYFASLGDVTVSYDVDTNPLTCCCGGQGLIRQVIKGDGMAFIGAMGVLTSKTLEAGETLVVDTTSVVAWQDSVHFDVRRTGGLCTCCCAGEGLFNTTLQGPGEVFLQSYSHGKFKQFAEIWALQHGAHGGLATQGGAAFGGAPSAAEGAAVAPANPMDRKAR